MTDCKYFIGVMMFISTPLILILGLRIWLSEFTGLTHRTEKLEFFPKLEVFRGCQEVVILVESVTYMQEVLKKP